MSRHMHFTLAVRCSIPDSSCLVADGAHTHPRRNPQQGGGQIYLRWCVHSTPHDGALAGLDPALYPSPHLSSVNILLHMYRSSPVVVVLPGCC